jgi:hypothetical protein
VFACKRGCDILPLQLPKSNYSGSFGQLPRSRKRYLSRKTPQSWILGWGQVSDASMASEFASSRLHQNVSRLALILWKFTEMTSNFLFEIGLNWGDCSGLAVGDDRNSGWPMLDTLLLTERSVSFSLWSLSNRVELEWDIPQLLQYQDTSASNVTVFT